MPIMTYEHEKPIDPDKMLREAAERRRRDTIIYSIIGIIIGAAIGITLFL